MLLAADVGSGMGRELHLPIVENQQNKIVKNTSKIYLVEN